MRKWSCIILIIAYLGTILSSIAPVVYYFGNRDYIAQNLCENKDVVEMECNGKCYLNKELSKTKPSAEGNEQELLELEKSPELLGDELVIFSVKYLNYILKYSDFDKVYSSDFISDVFHPPSN